MDVIRQHGSRTMTSPRDANTTFATVVEQRLSRRDFLGSVSATAVALSLAGKTEASAPVTLGFTGIKSVAVDDYAEREKLQVAANHEARVLLRWGDPVVEGAPPFDARKLTSEGQAKQFGYNCDFIGFLPLVPTERGSGLLVVNHEYTNPELMFPNYEKKKTEPSKEQADIELAAHGLSVVEIHKNKQGHWQAVFPSRYNRRITATTEMWLTGPAAGEKWMRTQGDATGTRVRGTLNNCSGGKTPWGTVLSGEENFHYYFANAGDLPDGDIKDAHARYGLPKKKSDHGWEKHHTRFDCLQEPHEAFRFGWVVEVDPFDPKFVPRKRTALGRFRHEAATVVVTPAGRIVLYSGDDERFEYVYKFVSAGAYHPTDRQANLNLLDYGTLFVARFNPDGTGVWLPLVFGQEPLTPTNGFTSQGDVLINTRQAADHLGATKMDRPEDIEVNPVTKKVYIVLTNNTDRGKKSKPGVDAANPRPRNKDGHVVELMEQGDDHTATKFTWNLFLTCGDPKDPATSFAGFPKEKVSPISCPDNVTFDLAGNLWIATDGAPKAIKTNDGLFAVPVTGPRRGELKQFLTAPYGAEVCGPEFTPDNTTLFVAIQHPGESDEGLSSFLVPSCRWPDGGNNHPRPSVVAIQHYDGKRVGEA